MDTGKSTARLVSAAVGVDSGWLHWGAHLRLDGVRQQVGVRALASLPVERMGIKRVAAGIDITQTSADPLTGTGPLDTLTVGGEAHLVNAVAVQAKIDTNQQWNVAARLGLGSAQLLLSVQSTLGQAAPPVAGLRLLFGLPVSRISAGPRTTTTPAAPPVPQLPSIPADLPADAPGDELSKWKPFFYRVMRGDKSHATKKT